MLTINPKAEDVLGDRPLVFGSATIPINRVVSDLQFSL